jgi:hypothetical protein
MRKLIIVAAATMMFAACGSNTGSGSAVSSPAITKPAATTVAPPTSPAPVVTTETSTTALAATTTLGPTGSVQSCEALRTLDDPDSDGWGECLVSMEDAQQQYFLISGDFNKVVLPMGDLVSTEECPAYLTASQTFVDDLEAASWPATVNAQLNELVQAGEEELVLRDDACDADEAELDVVITRIHNAVDAWRLAISAPTA